ncbi:hypothetical protein DFP74_5285 [Nocardiopsis sp. Huas11]|uniref:DUF6416 domain-containing protein n=1 Tax=Nocardiopsis sp. Huas11 TaxID=2183912 RepID=UPI000EB2E12B|nr:DUF6416 domain-containing protein [Nocardiopsis sp. Huas11]RKS09546.1 hypothetical protein DFP74_5285 [Nocardiopsis sp. Huas11]
MIPLSDNSPLWGAGHASAGDPARFDGHDVTANDSSSVAEILDAIAPDAPALVLIDHLAAHPGQRISSDAIIAEFPDEFTNRHSVADSTSRINAPFSERGFRPLFYWWKSKNGEPSTYAMKHSVAAVVRSVRRA